MSDQTVSITAYDVTLSIHIKSTDTCCGIRYIGNFSVRGRTGSLSTIKINNLYKLLYLKMRKQSKHTFIATDSIRFGWDGTGHDSERTDNVSLGAMCRYLKFSASPGGWNPNNNHEICVYMDSLKELNADKSGWKDRVLPTEPKLPKPKPVKLANAGDIEQVAAAIVAYITTH